MKKVCMVCGKPSELSICKECKAKIQGEALDKKKRIEKEAPIEPDLLKKKRER